MCEIEKFDFAASSFPVLSFLKRCKLLIYQFVNKRIRITYEESLPHEIFSHEYISLNVSKLTKDLRFMSRIKKFK